MTEPDPLENIEFSRDAVAQVQELSSSDRLRLASGLRVAFAKFKQGDSAAVRLEGTDYFSIPVAGGSVIAREIPASKGFIVASVRDMQSLSASGNQADAGGGQLQEASPVQASSPSQVAAAQVQEGVAPPEVATQAQDTAKAQEAAQVQNAVAPSEEVTQAAQVQPTTVAQAVAQVQEAVAQFQAMLEAQETANAQEAEFIKNAIAKFRETARKPEEAAQDQEVAPTQQQ